MVWYINKQEATTLKGLLPPDVVVIDSDKLGTDNVIQGVEKNRMYERKTLQDLLASIHDGRIFEQLKDLSNNRDEYEPFVIVEGQDWFDWTLKRTMTLKTYFELYPARKMAYYEAMTAFRAFGVGQVWTVSKEDTALYLTYENIKLGKPKEKKEFPERRGFRRDWDNEKKKLYVLEAFGPATAKALLKQFNSIDFMFNSKEGVEEVGNNFVEFLADTKLASGRRIGEAKAKEIYEVLFT